MSSALFPPKQTLAVLAKQEGVSLNTLVLTFISPTACLYHYLLMARGNYREYLKGNVVWIKKYFYVLRPVLAMSWIDQGWGVVPTDFNILVDKPSNCHLLRRKQRDSFIRLRQKKRNETSVYDGQFTSRHVLGEPGRPALYNQVIDR